MYNERFVLWWKKSLIFILQIVNDGYKQATKKRNIESVNSNGKAQHKRPHRSLWTYLDNKNFAFWNVLIVNIQVFPLKYKNKLTETQILLFLLLLVI